MFSRTLSSELLLITFLASIISHASAHTVISYPGMRGNNLRGGNETFPYDMQWLYPCGGVAITQNRTKWPLNGGAIAIQPGWFQGHATAFFYVNMGFQTEGPGTEPLNMSNPMVPPFQIIGPSRERYNGAFCLPQVPLPAHAPAFKVGDNATIQVVETAIHGAALYNCIDITFAEPADVDPVNETNCFNTSTISFNQIYGTNASSGGLPTLSPSKSWYSIGISLPLTIVAAITFLI